MILHKLTHLCKNFMLVHHQFNGNTKSFVIRIIVKFPNINSKSLWNCSNLPLIYMSKQNLVKNIDLDILENLFKIIKMTNCYWIKYAINSYASDMPNFWRELVSTCHIKTPNQTHAHTHTPTTLHVLTSMVLLFRPNV